MEGKTSVANLKGGLVWHDPRFLASPLLGSPVLCLIHVQVRLIDICSR